jgi:hypothetical protein
MLTSHLLEGKLFKVVIVKSFVFLDNLLRVVSTPVKAEQILTASGAT